MSSMDKMWASFYAIGLMLVATVLVTYARSKTQGVVRFVLSIIAFLLLIPVLILMAVSLL